MKRKSRKTMSIRTREDDISAAHRFENSPRIEAAAGVHPPPFEKASVPLDCDMVIHPDLPSDELFRAPVPLCDIPPLPLALRREPPVNGISKHYPGDRP
ncbi:hypothetical protein J2T58_001987 [Methanocalculus alkaliphilus]|uniref:hypothetical protein n=1 Tax=Methanocalculus alkaliphilus TaxID=768730 RepID=UPI0020A08C64|nr:hypothetical protein [Methanocalculus alkaliphilus]MCP1716112.1 hypothetical protein [Methanocalculus alkaliphilus]